MPSAWILWDSYSTANELMRDRVFIDTNILIYAYSAEEDKRTRAIDLISENEVVISLQVLNEFINVLKKKFGKTVDEIFNAIREIEESLTILNLDVELIKRALYLGVKYGYSYYDSLIIASALVSGCSVLFTEDMQHNHLVEKKLRIINPFR